MLCEPDPRRAVTIPRAAWWINYDLLCRTRRALPCFEVSLNTLDRTYESRNRCIGPHRPGVHGDEAFKALERIMARDGPLPKPGLRAALWHGMDFDHD